MTTTDQTDLTSPLITEIQTFWARLDNYEPIGREHHRGKLIRYKTSRPGTWVIASPNPFIWKVEAEPNPIFLLDDGSTVEPYYVTGWNENDGSIFIGPLPTNPNDERDSKGRVIDFRTWALGPRRAYHFKLYE